MEKRRSKYNSIKELPEIGNCLVDSEMGIAMQINLFPRGHHWKFIEINAPIWDPTEDITAEGWWDEHNTINGEKHYIISWNSDLGYTWSTALSSIGNFENAIEFSDYFKEKEEYVGYFAGKKFGL
jgi:hypothetical protein